MTANHEEHILQSWHTNAAAWTNAISQGSIESRKLATNKAIVDAIVHQKPRTMLDVGCGEGWLCRAAQSHGIDTTGIDAIPALIDAAKAQGGGVFKVCSYQDLVAGSFKTDKLFDLVVFNFSLFGEELAEQLLRGLHAFIHDGSSLIIQTLHPHSAAIEPPYQTGWRNGSWAGFSDDFTDPAPWYFRTLESWIQLLSDAGYATHRMVEPIHPNTGKPVSVIFVARRQ